MRTQLLSFTNLPSRRWSGGVTQQIALYPEGASFEERTFLLRISTATVSTSGPFTPFPGFQRRLMLLEGDGMDVMIGKESFRLSEPYQQLSFSGDECTSSSLLGGEVRDLNVIFRPSVQVSVESLCGVTGQPLPSLQPGAAVDQAHHVDILFSLTGAFSLDTKGSCVSAAAREICIVDRKLLAASDEALSVSSPLPNDVVWIRVVLPKPSL